MGIKIHEVIYGDQNEHRSWFFWCPGCDNPHSINETWAFDGNYESPTINPSILVTMPNPDKQKLILVHEYRCHLYIREGRIEFLSDCSHDLAGNTVDIPDYPDSWK